MVYLFLRADARIFLYMRPKVFRSRKKRGKSAEEKLREQVFAEGKQHKFLEVRGVIEELLPSAMFRVRLENGHEILAHLSGKMRMFRIRILPSDTVTIEMSPYDLTKGRIIYRH